MRFTSFLFIIAGLRFGVHAISFEDILVTIDAITKVTNDVDVLINDLSVGQAIDTIPGGLFRISQPSITVINSATRNWPSIASRYLKLQRQIFAGWRRPFDPNTSPETCTTTLEKARVRWAQLHANYGYIKQFAEAKQHLLSSITVKVAPLIIGTIVPSRALISLVEPSMKQVTDWLFDEALTLGLSCHGELHVAEEKLDAVFPRLLDLLPKSHPGN